MRELLEKNPDKHTELMAVIKKFRDEEQEHHDIGLEHDAEKVIRYFHIFFFLNLFKKYFFLSSQYFINHSLRLLKRDVERVFGLRNEFDSIQFIKYIFSSLVFLNKSILCKYLNHQTLLFAIFLS